MIGGMGEILTKSYKAMITLFHNEKGPLLETKQGTLFRKKGPNRD